MPPTPTRRRLTWFRVASLLALLVAVGGALTPWVASVVSPTYRVWRLFPVEPGTPNFVWGYATQAGVGHQRYDVGGLDPWGNRWRRRDAYEGWSVWSKGPDGKDDGGGGDDVSVDTRAASVELAPSMSVALALLLLWLIAALRALTRPRGPELGAEVGRALFAASVPAVGLGLLVREHGLPELLERGPGLLLVPREVAVVGAAWLVLSLAALAWRVRPKARRGRLPLRLRTLFLAPLFAATALATAWRGQEAVLERRAGEGRLAMAFAGDVPSFAEVCSKGTPAEVQKIVEAAPTYRATVRLDDAGVRALARFGPAVNRYIIGTLLDSDWRWGSGKTADPRLGLTHLLRHDAGLTELAAALVEGRRPMETTMGAAEPLLVIALLGYDVFTVESLGDAAFVDRWGAAANTEGALHALLVLRGDPALPRTRRAVSDLDASERSDVEEALRPWIEALGGELSEQGRHARRRRRFGFGGQEPAKTPPPLPDRWLVVVVTGATDPDGLELLLGDVPTRINMLDLPAPHVLVAGPLQTLPEGTVLSLLERRADRQVTTPLPGLGDAGTVWVDADLGSDVRPARASGRRVRDRRLGR